MYICVCVCVCVCVYIYILCVHTPKEHLCQDAKSTPQ